MPGLKPCPYCQSGEKVLYGGGEVCCDGCGFTTPDLGSDEANCAEWNRLCTQADRIRELEDCLRVVASAADYRNMQVLPHGNRERARSLLEER